MKAFNLDRHWADVGDQVTELANSYMSKGIFQRGDLTEQLEERICNITNKNYCSTYGSGTAALTQGLRTLELPQDTEVLVPAYTFLASASAISLAGLKPIFVDVDKFYHIDLQDAKSKITDKTKVLLYVSLLGSPARNDISDWCKDKGLLLVEDAAQSFGAPLSNAVFNILSFSPTKPCTSFGSGGAIVTNDSNFAKHFKLGRLHGKQSNNDPTQIIGVNSVMSIHEIASVSINLNLLQTHKERRKDIADIYYSELTGIVEFANYRKFSTYSKFVIKHANRDAMPGTVHYKQLPVQEPIYNQKIPPMCKHLQQVSTTLPNCAYMTDNEIESTIDRIKAVA
jgi:UDP-2-acetamido-2-deoxy-ribo-hexuluronate aminotransferase